jgi:hypothetical protein
MTTIIDGSLGVTFPNGSNPQAAPSKVLQVVNAATTTNVSNTSNSVFVDTTLTATITPLFSTSKILVLVSQNGVNCANANIGNTVILLKNGSQISTFSQFGGYGLSQPVASISINYLDSPATTSAVTYKTQFKISTGSGSVLVQDDGCQSTITLMEIAQ